MNNTIRKKILDAVTATDNQSPFISPTQLADALSVADFAVLPPVENYKKLLPEERLDLQLLCEEITQKETPCYVGSSVDDIVAYVVNHVHPGDVLLVMSNGGFGGIHNKLLIGLAQ